MYEFSIFTNFPCPLLIHKMINFRVRTLRPIFAQRIPWRNHDALIVRKFYSTHRLAEQHVKTPNFTKEFKGMKAEFPCLARLYVKF